MAALIVTWRCESRRWVQVRGLGALALVAFQGVLGGLRVLLDDRQIAQLHGIVGPTFFAYAVFFAAITSRWWQAARSPTARYQASSRPQPGSSWHWRCFNSSADRNSDT